MENEILKSTVSARSALTEIANSISQFEWPSVENRRKWTVIYETLINKNKFDAESEISESVFTRIKRNVDEYFSTGNFSVLVRYSRDFRLLCSNLDSNKISVPPLTDKTNKDKLIKFLHDLSRNSAFGVKSFLSLLSANLRYENGISLLSSFLENQLLFLSNVTDSDIKSIVQHKDLYFSKKLVIENLIKTDAKTLKDSLQRLGVLSEFLSEKYKWFSGLFVNWMINRPYYDIDLIQNNYERINSCTPDEIKVIEASVIVRSKDEKDFLQTFLDVMQMKTADAETFWHLNNPSFQERFSKVLSAAHKIVRTMITRDFIYLVFKYLGMNTFLDTHRVTFWIKYAGSIKNFKLFMPNYDKKVFRSQILSSKEYKNQLYAEILERHSLKDRGSNPTGAIALIMQFENLIVVEFPKTGKPIQIYQPENGISKLFEPHASWSELYEIQQYKDIQGERYVDNYRKREGSLAHRGSWEGLMQQVLRDYGILTDKGRN